MNTKRKLKMKIAGRFIDLLGHQMYGGAVPAVAEFVANAWDADSKKVSITISGDETLTYSEIRIRDFGEGMTFDELNDYYLTIGYERRKVRGERTESGRLVMGRKGIGKLAGFGIAEDIILRSVKNGRVVQFTLNYTALKDEEELGGFEFEPEIDEPSTEETGVTVILSNLKLQRSIGIDSFRKSLARRFALNTELMKIYINGAELTKESLDFEYREPGADAGWAESDILGFGRVAYWFGFLKETIKDKELRGISVFARDRLAQATPFFFNLTGGIDGQVGLEYLTGQVKADVLDEDIDYVATPRQSVNWQFGKASLLEAWGIQQIKGLCKEWKKRREERNLAKFKHDYSEFYPRIDVLPGQEKTDVVEALERIAGLERVEVEEFRVIANSLIAGVERESVRKVIMKINTTSEDALPELYEAIKEWDIISAVAITEVVVGRIEIIKQFRRHIDNRLREKAAQGHLDMQVFIRDHPWLLGQRYEDLKAADFDHERGVDSWIEEKLQEVNKEYDQKDEREGRRFDLLCIKSDLLILILELMRPGLALDYDHVTRLNRYVTRIQTYAIEMGKEFAGKKVFGLLIADYATKDPSLAPTVSDLRNNLEVYNWDGLFTQVQAGYAEYLEILKMKAPDDPRIKGLVNL